MYASVTTEPAWWGVENLIVHNRAFHSDLAQIDPVHLNDSIALFPTVGHEQLLGLFRWMSSFPTGSLPKVAACLMAPKNWSGTNDILRMYKLIWDRCSPAVKDRVALFSRTSQIATMFNEQVGLPSAVFPLVIPEHQKRLLSAPAVSGSDAMTISYLGGSRREKGAHLIADAVTRCANLNVKFLIQAQAGSHDGFDIQTLTKLNGLPNVDVREGTLSQVEYYDAMCGSVALVPYSPCTYRWDDSSVYHEAKLMDVPVLVTEGTWMADEVRSAGNGLVINEFTAAAVADCIARAQQELATLRANAVRVGQAFRQAQGVARCLAAVEDAIKSREVAARRKP